jgi:quinol---cytochrome c reductase iron-sulfur subunit, bacillus type
MNTAPALSNADSFRLPQRRSFLTRAVTILIGALVAIFPFAAGLGVFFDPLRRRRAANGANTGDNAAFLRICPLDALPADGVPRLFPIVTDVVDAWSRTPGERIGSVFLTRSDEGGKPTVICFTSTCPHLGCAVDWHSSDDHYECPCHVSAFAKDGKKLFGPALRGLDSLEVKLEESGGQTNVLVAYERFRTGIAERIPIG